MEIIMKKFVLTSMLAMVVAPQYSAEANWFTKTKQRISDNIQQRKSEKQEQKQQEMERQNDWQNSGVIQICEEAINTCNDITNLVGASFIKKNLSKEIENVYKDFPIEKQKPQLSEMQAFLNDVVKCLNSLSKQKAYSEIKKTNFNDLNTLENFFREQATHRSDIKSIGFAKIKEISDTVKTLEKSKNELNKVEFNLKKIGLIEKEKDRLLAEQARLQQVINSLENEKRTLHIELLRKYAENLSKINNYFKHISDNFAKFSLDRLNEAMTNLSNEQNKNNLQSFLEEKAEIIKNTFSSYSSKIQNLINAINEINQQIVKMIPELGKETIILQNDKKIEELRQIIDEINKANITDEQQSKVNAIISEYINARSPQ